jgi:hypothetical protein
VREGAGPKSQMKEYNGVLLEMLISEVGEMSVLFVRPLSSVPLESSLPSPFIGSRGG